MSKRRVYEPGRDRGWSNGRYWKEKHNSEPDDAVYDAFCEDCQKLAPHQWDECVVCEVNRREHAKHPTAADKESSTFVQYNIEH